MLFCIQKGGKHTHAQFWVCDDDAAFAARMDEYISEWFRAREIQVQSTVCTSGEQLLATPELERYQLAFLDVD
mgnify:CR=1 FL=1